VDNTEKSIGVVKRKAGNLPVHVMDLRESVYLRDGKAIAYDRVPALGALPAPRGGR